MASQFLFMCSWPISVEMITFNCKKLRIYVNWLFYWIRVRSHCLYCNCPGCSFKVSYMCRGWFSRRLLLLLLVFLEPLELFIQSAWFDQTCTKLRRLCNALFLSLNYVFISSSIGLPWYLVSSGLGEQINYKSTLLQICVDSYWVAAQYDSVLSKLAKGFIWWIVLVNDIFRERANVDLKFKWRPTLVH